MFPNIAIDCIAITIKHLSKLQCYTFKTTLLNNDQ